MGSSLALFDYTNLSDKFDSNLCCLLTRQRQQQSPDQSWRRPSILLLLHMESAGKRRKARASSGDTAGIPVKLSSTDNSRASTRRNLRQKTITSGNSIQKYRPSEPTQVPTLPRNSRGGREGKENGSAAPCAASRDSRRRSEIDANERVATQTKDLGSGPRRHSNMHVETYTQDFNASKDSGSRENQTPRLSIYQEAKLLFRRSASPGRLIGRDDERTAIRRFLDQHITEKRPGSLYVSGAPGTGKTALINEVTEALREEIAGRRIDRKVVFRSINCMTVSDPKAIFQKILELIDGAATDTRSAAKLLEERFSGSGKRKESLFVLVLDEIDCLLSKNQDVLYKLFGWPTLPNSRLILLGVANALDLTERFLPRLGAKGIEPQLLHFNPYGVKDIINIISERLRNFAHVKVVGNLEETTETSANVPLIQTSAIEICARKVAAASGDLRRAMDVCCQAIELVETEYRRKIGESVPARPAKRLRTSTKTNSAVQSTVCGAEMNRGQTPAPLEVLTICDAPKVTVSHVLRVLLSTTGPSGVAQKLRDLSTQQKQVLAVLHLLLTKGHDFRRGTPSSFYADGGQGDGDSSPATPSIRRNATVAETVTVASLYDAYVFHTSRRSSLLPVTHAEYLDIVSCLETSGILRLSSGTGRKGRVRSHHGTPQFNPRTPKTPRSNSDAGAAGTDDLLVSLGVQEDDVYKMITDSSRIVTYL